MEKGNLYSSLAMPLPLDVLYCVHLYFTADLPWSHRQRILICYDPLHESLDGGIAGQTCHSFYRFHAENYKSPHLSSQRIGLRGMACQVLAAILLATHQAILSKRP
jgi:hypothetical protein